MYKSYSFILFILSTIALSGCNSCNNDKRSVTKQEKLDEAKVEEQKIELVYKRLDLDLFDKKPEEVTNNIPALQKNMAGF